LKFAYTAVRVGEFRFAAAQVQLSVRMYMWKGDRHSRSAESLCEPLCEAGCKFALSYCGLFHNLLTRVNEYCS
jgi:hypothetical protein